MGLRPQTLYGIADFPRRTAAYFLDDDASSYALISRVFSGEAAGLTRGRCPRQHHAYVVDEHGDFLWPSLLGEQALVLQRQRRVHPRCRERVSRRVVSNSAELGRAGVSQTDPLQQARKRRALCGLGTAATPLTRASRRLQIAAHVAETPSVTVTSLTSAAAMTSSSTRRCPIPPRRTRTLRLSDRVAPDRGISGPTGRRQCGMAKGRGESGGSEKAEQRNVRREMRVRRPLPRASPSTRPG